jgi:hypothetical protein
VCRLAGDTHPMICRVNILCFSTGHSQHFAFTAQSRRRHLNLGLEVNDPFHTAPKSLRENTQKETADLSTTLRSGRDDKFVTRTCEVPLVLPCQSHNKFVISTGAQRSGEICGFFSSVRTQTRKPVNVKWAPTENYRCSTVECMFWTEHLSN